MKIYSPSITGSTAILGSLEVSGGITGSLLGSASFAANAGLINGTGANSLRSAPFLTTTPATASGIGAIAIGEQAEAQGNYSIAIGFNTEVFDTARTESIAIGKDARTAQYSIALGSQTDAVGANATSIGYGAQTSGNDSIAIGTSANSQGTNAISIGKNTTANATDEVNIQGKIRYNRASNGVIELTDDTVVTGSLTVTGAINGSITSAATASYVSGTASSLSGDLRFENILGEIYGTAASPVTGNLTISATSNKKAGAVAVVYHTGSVEPTVSGGTINKKVGNYSTTTLNVITFTCIDDSNFLEYIAGGTVTTVTSASFATSASFSTIFNHILCHLRPNG